MLLWYELVFISIFFMTLGEIVNRYCLERMKQNKDKNE